MGHTAEGDIKEGKEPWEEDRFQHEGKVTPKGGHGNDVTKFTVCTYETVKDMFKQKEIRDAFAFLKKKCICP